jgi:hypothetical protein
MTERVETCPGCGRFTERGQRQRREESKARPIYGTDFSKPLSVLVEGLRNDITKIRGQLSDISYAYPGWGEHLKCVEGLLTCGLIALYETREEMKAIELRGETQGAKEDGE